MPFERITLVGTGLIGASVGLALREKGFAGTIAGWDNDPEQVKIALERGAITQAAAGKDAALQAAVASDVIVLAVPVFGILDWMQQLAPLLKPGQLVTDVGSTKLQITQTGEQLFNQENTASFLPGHPMAGKESGGAALAEASLFENAVWLFTPEKETAESEAIQEWRAWVAKFGCRTMDLDAARHDTLCAWVSHLPQMVSTALSALLEDEFGDAPDMLRAIGGRALREMTRLGSSPYSMWRDVALSNTVPLADTLLALEQRLAHIRENLKTPELREEFDKANHFRNSRQG
ncbi:MAG: prephenate dehydrogenase [Acidobacteriaceae bacterium]